MSFIESATPHVNSVAHSGELGNNKGFVNNAENRFNNELYWTIDFVHVATNKCVNFLGMITEFSDNLTSNWSEESVYGRMDPIKVFQNTQRQISLSWVVVSTSVEMAQKNLHKFEHLASMLYPTYETHKNAETMAAGPLLRLKFTNLIQDSNAGKSPSALKGGLLGTSTGFSMTPNLDVGFYSAGPGILYPKEYTVSTQFTVLHTQGLGWAEGATWRGSGKGLYGVHNLTGRHSTCPRLGGSKPMPKKTKAKRDETSPGGFTAVNESATFGNGGFGSQSDPTSNSNMNAGERAAAAQGQRRDDLRDIVQNIDNDAQARVAAAGPTPKQTQDLNRQLAATEDGNQEEAQKIQMNRYDGAIERSKALQASRNARRKRSRRGS